MFKNKWLPVYAPETEAGAGSEEGQGTPPPSEGRVSGRSELRKQLEKNFEADRKTDRGAEREGDRGDGRSAEGKYVRGGAASREQQEDTEQETEVETREQGEVAEPTEQVAEEQQEAEGQETVAAVAAPEGWSKEAKAEWAKLPAPVQAAVKKREVDMAKGVADLKGKYSEIDQALAPHNEAIRRFNKTPGEAVAHLFAWFAALSGNPQAAFPALARSFGHDLRQFVEASPEAQKGQGQQQEQESQLEVPEALKPLAPFLGALMQELQTMKGSFDQKFGQLETSFASSSQQKAEETLAVWSKDKPYFEQVRDTMARLINGRVVPLKDGKIDLDATYERALFFEPEIREKVLADKEAAAAAERKRKGDAERKAQQDRADKARKASAGLGPSAPGAPGAPRNDANRKNKSVRESLQEAIESHRS